MSDALDLDAIEAWLRRAARYREALGECATPDEQAWLLALVARVRELETALGHTSPPHLAKRSDYGWSPAYSDVLFLRENFDLLWTAVQDFRTGAAHEGTLFKVAYTIRERMERRGRGEPVDG